MKMIVPFFGKFGDLQRCGKYSLIVHGGNMGNRDYVRELCVLFSTARNKTRKKQPEIAKELDVSVGSIKQWESTGPPPSRDRIPSLAVAYAITEEQLHQAFDLIEQNKMPSVRHLLKPHKKKRHPSAESMYF